MYKFSECHLPALCLIKGAQCLVSRREPGVHQPFLATPPTPTVVGCIHRCGQHLPERGSVKRRAPVRVDEPLRGRDEARMPAGARAEQITRAASLEAERRWVGCVIRGMPTITSGVKRAIYSTPSGTEQR